LHLTCLSIEASFLLPISLILTSSHSIPQSKLSSTSLANVKMASPQQIKTPITDLLKIKHPVLLAGMNVAAGPRLAAAVTNAGGLGVIGGVRLLVEILTLQF
jgi:Nitronate monooxygenase